MICGSTRSPNGLGRGATELWAGHVMGWRRGWNPMQRFGIGWATSDKVANKRFDPYPEEQDDDGDGTLNFRDPDSEHCRVNCDPSPPAPPGGSTGQPCSGRKC